MVKSRISCIAPPPVLSFLAWKQEADMVAHGPRTGPVNDFGDGEAVGECDSGFVLELWSWVCWPVFGGPFWEAHQIIPCAHVGHATSGAFEKPLDMCYFNLIHYCESQLLYLSHSACSPHRLSHYRSLFRLLHDKRGCI